VLIRKVSVFFTLHFIHKTVVHKLNMTETSNYKKILDEIQKIIHADLKRKGFKKRGRTHNREVENGIIQVINFQMDKYPIGPNYEIPRLRESFWGKFTVNLGVYVEELFTAFHNEEKKSFVQDYDCEIRTRLSHLTTQRDKWYLLDKAFPKIAEKILNGLFQEGQIWFDRFDKRDKIVSEFKNKKQVEFSPREKLNGAIIQLQIDRTDGEQIFRDYYNSLDYSIPRIKGHKEYISELGKKLKIDLK